MSSEVFPRHDVYRCEGCGHIYDNDDFCEDCLDYCLNCCEGHGPWCNECSQVVERLYDEKNAVCEKCWTPRCPRCSSKNTRLNAHMILKCWTCTGDWEADLPVGKWVQVLRTAANIAPRTYRMDEKTKKFMMRAYGSWDAYKRTKEDIRKITQETEPTQQQEIQMHSYQIDALKGHIDKGLEVLVQAESRLEELHEELNEKVQEAASQALAEGVFTAPSGKEVDVTNHTTSSRLEKVAYYFRERSVSPPLSLPSVRKELEERKDWLNNLSGEAVELNDAGYKQYIAGQITNRKTLEKWLAEHPSDDTDE